MINNNAEFLSRGMKILTEQMGFVDVETFGIQSSDKIN